MAKMTEEQAIEWVSLHMPYVVKTQSKSAKSIFAPIFTTNYAKEQTIIHIGKELHKLLNS